MKKKILIVDDDKDIRVYYILILKKEFDIIEACNGLEAIEHYKAYNPDLTLMDIRMPFLNGDKAIKIIKDFNANANIIAATAFSYSEEELKVPVLRKGFTKKQLLNTIHKTLK